MRIRFAIVSSVLALSLLMNGTALAQEAQPTDRAQTGATGSTIEQRIYAAQLAEYKGNYAESIRLWTQLAEEGIPEAQIYLGVHYKDAPGQCRDDIKAIAWLTKAASQGYSEAYRHLGDIYWNGDDTLRDPFKASEWYQKAAEKDDLNSQIALSQLYAGGEGIPKNYAKTIYWLEKAGAQGSVISTYYLGMIYNSGKNVHRNEDKAIYWYSKAANSGLTNAQLDLAGIYNKNGNYIEAYRWYVHILDADSKAMNDEGYKEDLLTMNKIGAKLTSAQRSKAKKIAAEAHISLFSVQPRVTPPSSPECLPPPPPYPH